MCFKSFFSVSFKLSNVISIFFSQCQASERKAYNPKTFCRTYTMDKQPLNTGEQKDMTEFFTDLIGKIEEMSPALVRNVLYLLGLSDSGYCV